MSAYDDLIATAAADIGYTEGKNNDNKFGKWYGWNNVSYCMIAVQYWHDKIGYTLPYKTASCSALLAWYKTNQPGRVLSAPKRGAIIIYNFGHTGICESWDTKTVTAIEANTSPGTTGSQTNGGGVYRRTRNRSTVTAYIDAIGGEDKTMQTVKGGTASETALIKAIQTAIGAIADGEIGTQTLSDIACRLHAIKEPVTLKIYSAPVIIAPNLVPFAGGGNTLAAYKNTLNGSFYAGGKPCSILVQDGVVKSKYACHASYGKPESVLYRLRDGTTGICRATDTGHIPDNVWWAVGGLGLLEYYNPAAEGFCKLTANGKTEDFSDVLRKTNHSMIGYKNGYYYLVYCPNMNADGANNLAKKLGLQYAIMLDGGHVAGINGAESFAKINTTAKQYYMIQGVKL